MASSTNKLTIVMALADQSLRSGIKRVQQQLKALGNSIESTGKSSRKAQPHLRKLGKTLERVGKSGKEAQQSLKGMSVSFERTGKSGRRAGNEVRKGTKQMELGLNNGRKSLARFSEALRTSIVNLRFLVVAFAGGAVTGAVAKFGGEFEKSLTNIDTLLIDNTKSAEAFGEELKQLASTTPKDLLDLSAALYQILSAGVPAADAMSVLNASTKLAISSISEVKDSANLLITTLNAYRSSGLSAADATDKLTKIYQLGRTTVTELAGSFGRVAPLAAQFGVDLDQVGGLLISLTRSGLRTNEALTATRAIISGIAKPTKKSQGILDRLGISFGQAAIDAHGFDGVLRSLLDTTGGNVDVLARLFPNIRALLPAVVTVGSGFREFEKNISEVKNAFGSTDEALEKSEGKFFKSAALLRSNFQNALVQISEDVLPVLRDEFDKLSAALNSETGQTFIESISSILVVLVKLAFTFGEVLRNAIMPFVEFFNGIDGNILRTVAVIGLLNAVLRRFFITLAGSAAFTKFFALLKTIPIAFSATVASANTAVGATMLQRFAAMGPAFFKAGVGAGTKTASGIFTGLTTGQAVAKIASGVSMLISGAFKLFFAGFVIFTLVKSLADMIFGASEREAAEAENKARAAAEKRLEEARKLFAQIERDKRGGSADEIEAKKQKAAEGVVIELTGQEAIDLGKITGLQAKYTKEAARFVSVQQLYRDIVKGLTRDLGDAERTEEKLAEVRGKALEKLLPYVEGRIQTGLSELEKVDLTKAFEIPKESESKLKSQRNRLVESVISDNSRVLDANRFTAGLAVVNAAKTALAEASEIAAKARREIAGDIDLDEKHRAEALERLELQLKGFQKAITTGKASDAAFTVPGLGSVITAEETFKRFGKSYSDVIKNYQADTRTITSNPFEFIFQSEVDAGQIQKALKGQLQLSQAIDVTADAARIQSDWDDANVNLSTDVSVSSDKLKQELSDAVQVQEGYIDDINSLLKQRGKFFIKPELDPAAFRDSKGMLRDLIGDAGTAFNLDVDFDNFFSSLQSALREQEQLSDSQAAQLFDFGAKIKLVGQGENYQAVRDVFRDIELSSLKTESVLSAQESSSAAIKNLADQRYRSLSRLLPVLFKIDGAVDTSTKNSVSLVRNLKDAVASLKAQMKSQKALKEDKDGAGRKRRQVNYLLRLEKALAKLQEKTAKLRRKNLLDELKLSERRISGDLKFARDSLALSKKQNTFYGKNAEQAKKIEEDRVRQLAVINLLIQVQAAAEEEARRQSIANTKIEAEERIAREEKTLRANLKGNAIYGARKKANEKRVADAIAAMRVEVGRQTDAKIVKIDLERIKSQREVNKKLSKNLEDTAAITLDRLKSQASFLKDSFAGVGASIDSINESLADPTGIRARFSALAKIKKLQEKQLALQKNLNKTDLEKIDALKKQKGREQEIANIKSEVSKREGEIARLKKTVDASVSKEIASALNLNRLQSREADALLLNAKAQARAAEGAKALGENIEILTFNERKLLESMDLLPSKMQKVRNEARLGLFGSQGGFIRSLSSNIQSAVNMTKFLGMSNIGTGLKKEMGGAALRFLGGIGTGLTQVAKDLPAKLMVAADAFTHSLAQGISNVGVGEFSFVTDSALQFAQGATAGLQTATDVIGSAFGLTIGEAIGESGAGSEIGGEAGTAFGLIASKLIEGSLAAVSRFVVDPIQSAVSRPFEVLSSGISSVFDSFLGDSSISEESSRRRLELAEREHFLRIDQINKEAEGKAALIDKDLSLTEDIGKIQELTARREEVRQDRDLKLLEERRKAFEAQRNEQQQSKDGPIDTIQKAVDGAMEMVDTLIEKLPGLAEEAVIGLTTALPKIIVGAANALGETLSRIAPLMSDLIKNIVSGLIDALPFILKGAADFAVGAVEGIIEAFIEILMRADEVVEPFISALVSAVPRIVGALIAASPRIVFSIIKAIPSILAELAIGLGRLLRDIFIEAGRALLNIVTFGAAGTLESGAGKAAAGVAGGAALGTAAYYGLSALFGASTGGLGFLAAGAIGAGIGGLASLFHDGGMVSKSLKNPAGAALFAGMGAPGFASGGMVSGIQNAVSGSGLRAFKRGVDDVPAVLQTGEAVLNRRAVMNLGEDTINALNSGQPIEPGPTSVNVSINPDSSGLNRVVSQLLPHLIAGVNAEVDRPGSRLRISSMNTGGRPMGTIRPRRG